jgi:RHS repeat-associated protein
MTIVNGVIYSWDNNGNLINDGVSSYTYDAANPQGGRRRLATLNDGTGTSSYTYNGLGDRLAQTVGGVTTNYTLDLNTGLTQVLTDGENTYLYGISRLAQNATDKEYFLSDALGSVRQLSDPTGAITLNRSYTPFGEVLSESGTGESIYGYTGEVTDESGLVFLRARYYLPGSGGFISKDMWSSIYVHPQSLQKWVYVKGDPINYVDPTGHCYPIGDSDEDVCVNVLPKPEPPEGDPFGIHPTIEPNNIVWSPSVNTHLLRIYDRTGNVVPPGTSQSQFNIVDLDGQEITGACGPLSIASVARWWDPQGLFLDSYDVTYAEGNASKIPVTPNYTRDFELIAIIQSLPQWGAYKVTVSRGEEYTTIKGELQSNHYPIPGVNINGNNGKLVGGAGHWLVVTGISAYYQWNQGKAWQWIRVFNPFNNQNEYYMWSRFLESWGGNPDGFYNRSMVVMYQEL